MRLSTILLALLALAGTAQALAGTAAADPPSDPTPVAAGQWHRVELYFAIGRWHGRSAARDDRRWRDFLDREVTPRFPQGLTVLDAYGQWLPPKAQHPLREHAKLLVILYPESPAAQAQIEAIRAAWKQRTGDVSVLRVDTPVEASF